MGDTASEVNAANGDAAPPPPATPVETVRRFLDLLQSGDMGAATDLLSDEVRYINVSLPVIRGRDRVRTALGRAFGVPGAGFEVYTHSISADGGTVLTERTDVLIFGPVRMQIWVCGRFDVAGGEIVMWKDYFDWWNATVALLRGVLGAAIPALRPKPPTG